MTSSIEKLSLRHVSDFGNIAADADQLLQACFERHPVYDAVVDGKTYAVFGRKGAGKTAIFSRLSATKDDRTVAIALDLGDYPWSHHKLQALEEVHEKLRFRASWTYLILLALASRIVAQYQKEPWSDSQEVFDATSNLEAFLIDTYGTITPKFTTLFVPSRRIKASGSIGAIFARLDLDSIEISQLPVHFADVNSAMQDAVFTAADPAIRYFVSFDGLDLAFEHGDQDYSMQIAGLLHASRDLFYAARSHGRSMVPVVFLRDDIFNDMRFQDRNKVRDDGVVLSWSEADAAVTLKTMMESRFSEVLGTETRPRVRWADVFEEDELTRGRRPKYDYIVDRTLDRPRDVIKFCNEALASFKRDRTAGDRITNAHLYDAKQEYSKYLLNEFRDELQEKMPEFDEVLEVLRSLEYDTFTVEDFHKKTHAALDWDSSKSLAKLTVLFEFSVIGFRRVGGLPAGSGWVWRYKDADRQFASGAAQLKVHPGLKEALQLKEVRKATQGGAAEQ